MTVIFSIYLIVIALILGMIWVPKNDFYGIRCPWSMYSKDVWVNIHRTWGYAEALPLCAASTALFTGDIGIDAMLVALVIPLLLTLPYSYAVYKAKLGIYKQNKALEFIVSDGAFTVFALIFSAVAFICLKEQADVLKPFDGAKIATHFNAANKPDGWMNTADFLKDMRNMQAGSVFLCATVAFIAIFFTKGVFEKRQNICSKIVIGLFSFCLCASANIIYFTGIIVSVAAANTPIGGRQVSIDLYGAPCIYYLIGFAATCALAYPILAALRAYVCLNLDSECAPYPNTCKE